MQLIRHQVERRLWARSTHSPNEEAASQRVGSDRQVLSLLLTATDRLLTGSFGLGLFDVCPYAMSVPPRWRQRADVE